ncbi:hypothetical protein COLO4_13386 [Corchorus olitorius]|uniref:Aminopeptidase n=1 Tax=Corchorus olitorius TaxID=93759 RepID=A0A1R3JWP4_9ROSI|nr:hypothetical protein COLO4_13386 [Corchorus olitorius]
MGKKKKKDIIRLERESVIPIVKKKLINTIADLIESKSEHAEFLKFCQRVEYTIRAWYLIQFDDLMQLFSLFEPVHGAERLEQQDLSPEEIDVLEQDFLKSLLKIINKSNFKITTDEEIDVASSGQYRLNLPIVVNESMLDKRLFSRFFAENPHDNLPHFADKFIIFRRGFGIDKMTAFFFKPKLETIIVRLWRSFLKLSGLKFLIRLFFSSKVEPYKKDSGGPTELRIESMKDGLYIERIRIEKLKLSISNLLRRITIQEPTFERIIVVYRRRADADRHETERNIYLKHFKNIPMADLEIVLPEKQNPGLTPMDWVKFLVSAAIGLSTVVGSLSMPKPDIKIIFGILSAVGAYCLKTYFSFQSNLVAYQSLITRCVYDKQLDSGRGTLLHLCDEVIQQEVKEVIVSFYILMDQGKALSKDYLDLRCEELIKENFGASCNFDVDDAVSKLEKLGVLSQDNEGRYTCVNLRRANEIIGTTTEEVVLQAKGDGDPYADMGRQMNV